jgi:hypothetical protein
MNPRVQRGKRTSRLQLLPRLGRTHHHRVPPDQSVCSQGPHPGDQPFARAQPAYAPARHPNPGRHGTDQVSHGAAGEKNIASDLPQVGVRWQYSRAITVTLESRCAGLPKYLSLTMPSPTHM